MSYGASASWTSLPTPRRPTARPATPRVVCGATASVPWAQSCTSTTAPTRAPTGLCSLKGDNDGWFSVGSGVRHQRLRFQRSCQGHETGGPTAAIGVAVPKYQIMLGVPGTGQISEEAAQASWLCTYRHDVDRMASNNSGPNLNVLWLQALNLGKK